MLGYGPIGLFPLGRSPYPAGIYPFVIDTHDGNRQFLRKKPFGEYDPSQELEIKARRREALELAFYGPPEKPEKRLKSALSKPKIEVIPSKPEDIFALAKLVMSARQAHQQQQDLMLDDAELDAVIREIFG